MSLPTAMAFGTIGNWASSPWVFDGYSTAIIFHDFKQDNGPGQSYHDDAVIHRYEDVNVARDGSDPTIPSHLILNKDNGWLYIVDIGNDRVIRMNTATGSFSSTLTGYESVAEYATHMGVEQETVVDTGLEQPCGIDIIEDRMIVSDYANGDSRFYDISETPALYLGKIETGDDGITGVKIGPEGNI